MLTMPIAGVFADKIGPGKIVLTGITVITISFAMWVPLGAETPYWYLLLALFIQGLGMGATMMPTFSAGLAALQEHTIARGSTLLNIIQQVAGSIGTAVFTVLLTNGFQDSPSVVVAGAVEEAKGDQSKIDGILQLRPERRPAPVAPRQCPRGDGERVRQRLRRGDDPVRLCLIPAAFLPRTKSETTHDQPVMMH